MCKALHAQTLQGKWVEMTLDSVAAVREAEAAVKSGSTVALSVADKQIAECLIPDLARRLQLLQQGSGARVILHTRFAHLPTRMLALLSAV